MRPATLTSNDYFTLSGFNYSTSPKSIPLNHKGFGYFNSPKSETQKSMPYSTKLKNESTSSRYSHKTNKDLDNSFERRNAKTRDYSATRPPSSLTYSNFYDNDRTYEDKKSFDLFKPSQTYNQSPSYRSSKNELSKSTYLRDPTREDANILTRKKYDVDINSITSIRKPEETRPSSVKNNNESSRWENSTPNKGTVTYYPLEEFISKYSPSRTNVASSSNYTYTPEKEKYDTNMRSLTQSRVMSSSTRPNTAGKSSLYDSTATSPYKANVGKPGSYLDRDEDDVEADIRSASTANFIAQYDIKKYDYKNIYDTPEHGQRGGLARSESNFGRSVSKPTDNDIYKKDLDYNRSYLNKETSYDNRDRNEYTYSNTQSNTASQPANEKLSLDSFITRVDRGAMSQPFKKNEDKDDYKSRFNAAKTVSNFNVDDKNYGQASPFKASHSLLNKEPKFYKSFDKAAQDSDLSYSNEASRWSGKLTRPSSSARRDESTDGSQQDEDSPVRFGTVGHSYYQAGLVSHLKKFDSRNAFSSIYREHFQQSFQAMKFCRYMKAPDARTLAKKKVYLPKKDAHKNRKTLIFDLDETLIHCVDSPMKRSDVKLSIKFPTGEIIEAGINVRPHAIEILKQMSEIFEVMVFTASHKSYANVVLDHIDPHNQYITHRLYRDSCVYTEEGVYVKDLRVIGNRNLQDMILVDNAAYSFGFQIENGVPCIPFYDDKNDEELKHLIPYLKVLNQARDIREVNKKTFKFAEYARHQTQEEVMRNVIFKN